MQQVACPGCGAPVQFRSPASVMAVCEFCKTTVLKDAESVRDIGKMSEVLEDFSPLQIGTSGRFGQRSFSLIGRIQLRYSAGLWNEWYALFDDGSSGWLSDASGQYTMTFAKPGMENLPLFEKLVPGQPLSFAGQTYTTSDVRTAQCTAGQGELPFKVGQGWQAKVADFRAGAHFLSLDYSDGGAANVFVGEAVGLAQLQAQLLRDTSQITETAGKVHGKVTALACPSCGAPVKCVPGITVHIVCPSCHAEVDTSGPTAAVLAAGTALGAANFTLELGADASIDGASYSVIGAMRRAESDGGSVWSEYFLYSPGHDFIWLVETSEGWQRAQVLNEWPEWDSGGHARLGGRSFSRDSDYMARVAFAAGAFNWRVSVGDTTRVTEFVDGQMRLAAEATSEELTWSRSAPVALDQVRAWFGEHVHVELAPHPKYMHTARYIIVALFLINAIPMLFATGDLVGWALLAATAIGVPAYFLDRLDAGAS
jgi:hypothetical protein